MTITFESDTVSILFSFTCLASKLSSKVFLTSDLSHLVPHPYDLLFYCWSKIVFNWELNLISCYRSYPLPLLFRNWYLIIFPFLKYDPLQLVPHGNPLCFHDCDHSLSLSWKCQAVMWKCVMIGAGSNQILGRIVL